MASEKVGAKRGTRTVLPMKLIEDRKKRYVSFSKRKKGLFAKSAALSSIFSGAVDIAAVIFSPQGKLFSFGHPSPDAVFRRYLGDSCEGHYCNYWWDNVDVNDLSFDELIMFKSSMEEVKIRVSNRINDLRGSEIKLGETIIGTNGNYNGFEHEDDYPKYDGLMKMLHGGF